MALFMDRHEIAGARPEDVALAHVRDLEVQEKHGVRYLTYWFDSSSGNAFCLADAPNKESAEAVHREAHGLVASQIIEVDPRTVEEFLGRIHEPPRGEAWTETAFRTIMFTDMAGSTSITGDLGDAGMMELLRSHDRIIRDSLAALGGREIKHTGDGVMACFASVVRGVECAIAIQRSLAAHNESAAGPPIKVRAGISAGEPVTENDDLFGAAVQLAARICAAAEPGQILAANVVRELAIGKGFVFADRGECALRGFEDPFRLFEVRWREAS